MRFRFILSHSILGSLEISEMDGWANSIMKLERHEEFHSLIEYFEGSFILYGNNGIVNGGIDFVKEVEQIGLDETIVVDIDVTFDELTFSNVFNGQYKLTDLEELPNNKMRIPIIRDDFWAKFIARKDTPVNLQSSTNMDDESVPPTELVRLHMLPQKLRQSYLGQATEGEPWFPCQVTTAFARWDFNAANTYGILDFPEEILDEITEVYHYPMVESPTIPFEKFQMEYAGEYIFDIDLSLWSVNEFTPAPISVEVFFKINNTGTPISLTRTDHATVLDDNLCPLDGRSQFTYSATHNLNKGDQIFLYIKANGSTYSVFMPNNAIFQTFLSVVANTIFPETICDGFFIHDVAAAICDRIIGEDNTFYSEHLGSPITRARQYDEDGCAWTYSLIKGLQLRQYPLTDKPFFQSFNQWWSGSNPVLNLSLMYDTFEGQPVIRVEEKAFQYIDDISVYFSSVSPENITRKYDNDRIFNSVEIGYTRWQSEDISGIDDPQTRKTYSTIFKKSGKPIKLLSEYIAASLTIEKTRRTIKEKSADYKYDDEVFIIALNPVEVDESPDEGLVHLSPELSEDFSSVTNLLNSETRYNLRITTGRNFLRWQNYVQGALQSYLSSSFRFASGEGNYDMTSIMTAGCPDEEFNNDVLNEKGDIPVTGDFLHLANLYEIDIPMDWSDYITIRDNRRKAIGVSLGFEGHVSMFIKTLDFKPVKGTATILAWAKEYLDLSVVADTTPMQECQPESDECETALTDEDGNILTDELGICIFA